MSKKVLDLVGQMYGRLLVLGEAAPVKRTISAGQGFQRYWMCLCECGNTITVRQECIRGKKPKTRSCGCLQKEELGNRQRKDVGESAFNKLFTSYVKKAVKRRMSFLLSVGEFRALTKQNCHYCGCAPYRVWKGRGGGNYIYNGVDRIDSSNTYESFNCVPCCWRCNFMKNEQSVDEFFLSCVAILSHSKPEVLKIARSK